ncbi:PLP-dependent transferase [Gonapodya prolifera JEL478]|uniref:PLP-dependent transferase n=1 Tax=Gonapodya prolifera (strain JEL478) TaxID=1344416 RepID=A0A139AM88_GONPJ|nr:PLP-dependent transferase [Gonapodya prolifera JEL478]|eukprot:KXS17896.1 PLP-dependent transferase [Gonapodya prolifera JEL478]
MPVPDIPPLQSADIDAMEWTPLAAVDLRFKEGDFEERRFEIAKVLKSACTGAGFFVLVNHGIDEAEPMYSLIPQILSLSKDEKLAHKTTAAIDGDYTGYVGDGTGDSVEYYNVGKFIPKFQKEHPDIVVKHYSAIKDYSLECYRVAMQVMRLLAIALEVPASAVPPERRVPGSPYGEHYIEDLHRYEDISGCHLRFMRYPPVSAEGDAKRDNIRVQAHTDFGSLTMMFNPKVVALQVLTGNKWRFVKPVDGSLICNISDTLQFITGGVLKSTQHRVLRPLGNHGDLERHNLIYFLRATDDIPLKPVPSPAIPSNPTDVVDAGMTAGEWVSKRVQAAVKSRQAHYKSEKTGEGEREAEENYRRLQDIINRHQDVPDSQLYVPISESADERQALMPVPDIPPLQSADIDATEWAPSTAVDLRFKEGDFEERRFEIAKVLKSACTGAGFFVLVNHGIDETEPMYSLIPQIFSLSKDEKMALKATVANDGDYTGYVGDGTGDSVEYYNVGKFIPKFQREPPDVIVNHCSAIEHFFLECRRIAMQVTRLLSIAFEVPAEAVPPERTIPGSPCGEHYIEDLHQYEDVSGCNLRFMRYPPASAEEDAKRGNIRVQAHTNFCSLTMIFNPKVVGLQVLTRNEWRLVKLVEGSVICNITDTLQFITGGVLKSTQHRVLRPPGNHGNMERHNLIFFLRASDDIALKPVPSPAIASVATDVVNAGMTARDSGSKRVQAVVKSRPTHYESERTDEREWEAGDNYRRPQDITIRHQDVRDSQLYVTYIGNQYDKVLNPGGIISLGAAENRCMWPETVARFARTGTVTVSRSMLSYDVPFGPVKLREAVANLWNTQMGPLLVPLDADNITVQAGCGQSIDAIMQVLCDPGEGILVPAPYYNGFDPDSTMEPSAVLIPCPMQPPDFSFSIESCRVAYDLATARGIKARVFLLCNPLNPLGRCYSQTELKSIMEFCGERRLHLVVDEIYALSYFGEAATSRNQALSESTSACHSDLPPYTSILSVTPPATLPPSSIHVLWGLSKDFGMNGIRMGVVITHNYAVLSALRAISMQHNVSVPMSIAVASVLSDTEWVASFIPENKRRIRRMYEVVKTWLAEWSIPFQEANAAFFVFVDLRRWTQMIGRVNGEAFVVVDAEAEDVDRSAEYDLFGRFVDGGVLCVNGGSYGCGDVGWFRLVYTAVDDENDLLLALARLGAVLEAVEKECKPLQVK